jgi:hypothetical protein
MSYRACWITSDCSGRGLRFRVASLQAISGIGFGNALQLPHVGHAAESGCSADVERVRRARRC